MLSIEGWVVVEQKRRDQSFQLSSIKVRSKYSNVSFNTVAQNTVSIPLFTQCSSDVPQLKEPMSNKADE